MICPWAAWQFNHAVTHFGISVQNLLDARDRFDKKGNPTYTLKDVLDEAQARLDGSFHQDHEPAGDYDKLLTFGRAMGMRIT